MRAENDTANAQPSRQSHEAIPEECLTDMIDQLARKAFRRALERRHAAPAYRTVIESANLVPTSSSLEQQFSALER